MGYEISIKYLPSQIAILSLYITCKILFQLEIQYMQGKHEINNIEIGLQEMVKVLGYNLYEGGLAQLKNEVLNNEAMVQMLKGYGYKFNELQCR